MERPPSTPEKEPKPDSSAAQHESRSVVRRLLKIAALLLMLMWGLATSFYWVISLLVSPDWLKGQIITAVQEQTGSKVTIGSIHFNVLNGIKVEDIKLFAPGFADDRGFLSGGAIQETPLLRADRILLDYRALALLIGSLDVRALKVVAPQIYLQKSDGVLSLQGILNYRARHLPPAPSPQKHETSPSVDEPDHKDKVTGLLPVDPNVLFLPLRLSVNDVGIERLSIHYVEEVGGQKQKSMSISPIDLGASMRWAGTSSAVHAWVKSSADTNIEIHHEAMHRPPISIEAPLRIQLSIVDLRELLFEVDTKIHTLTMESALPLSGKQLSSRLHLTLEDDRQSINLKDLHISVANWLNYDMAGRISVLLPRTDLLHLDLEQQLEIDLEGLTHLSTLLAQHIDASGLISIDSLRVKGDLDLSQRRSADMTSSQPMLPDVQMNVRLDEINVMSSSQQGSLALANLTGSLTGGLDASKFGESPRGNLYLDLSIEELSAKHHHTKLGEFATKISELRLRVVTLAKMLERALPVIKLDIEAASISGRGRSIGQFDLPFFLSIDGEGDANLEEVAFATRTELGDILHFTANGNCKESCKKFRFDQQLQLTSLKSLHSLAVPVVNELGLLQVFPPQLEGGIRIRSNGKGMFEHPLVGATNIEEQLRQASFQLETAVSLDDVNAIMPLNFGSIEELDVQANLLATHNSAAVRLETSLDKLHFRQAGNADQQITIRRLNQRLATEHRLNEGLTVNRPLRGLTSDINAKLTIGHFAAPRILQTPIDDISTTIHLSHKEDRQIHLERMQAAVRSLGLDLSAKSIIHSSAGILANPIPTRSASHLELSVDHTNPQNLPFGMRSSGKMHLESSVTTQAQKFVSIDGTVNVDGLSLQRHIEGEKQFELVEATGRLPFKQDINLEQLTSSLLKKEQRTTSSASTSLEDSLLDYKNRRQRKYGGQQLAVVDYSSFRPMIANRKPIFIKQVNARSLSIDNIEFDMELRQNWVALNQIVFAFLDGRVHGELQMAFDPLPKEIKLAFHLTKLDTSKLLASYPQLKSETANFSEKPYIDATVHLAFDITNNDLKGGIEISRIGKDQLRMILFYIDPNRQNPAIKNIQSGLKFGEVEWVSIPIKNSEFDLDVNVRFLGAPMPIPRIERFPIGQLIQNFISAKPKS